MTPQQVVGLSLRMFAIWLAICSIRYISLIPYNLLSNEMNKEALVSSAIGIAYLVAALVVWLFPMSVSNKLVPKTHFENRFNTRPDEVASVAISILGLWEIIDTAPAFVSYLFQAYLNSGDRSMFASLDAAGKSDIVFMLFELSIAVVLLLNAHKIALLITKQQMEN